MSDIQLNPINSGYNISKVNDNFTTIEATINGEVIHSVGNNNVMGQDLDMDSNRILNLPDALNAQEPVTLQQLDNKFNLAQSTVRLEDLAPHSITFDNLAISIQESIDNAVDLTTFQNELDLLESNLQNAIVLKADQVD